MKKTYILILVLILLAAGCSQGAQDTSQPENNQQPESSSQNEGSSQTGEADQQSPTDTSTSSSSEETHQPTESLPTEEIAETLGPDCYGDEVHPIGQSIADLYEEQTNYTQVMVWFCNGFPFEDILIALQTEEITEYTAEELLEAFKYGLTWEEIWAEIGLIDESEN